MICALVNTIRDAIGSRLPSPMRSCRLTSRRRRAPFADGRCVAPTTCTRGARPFAAIRPNRVLSVAAQLVGVACGVRRQPALHHRRRRRPSGRRTRPRHLATRRCDRAPTPREPTRSKPRIPTRHRHAHYRSDRFRLRRVRPMPGPITDIRARPQTVERARPVHRRRMFRVRSGSSPLAPNNDRLTWGCSVPSVRDNKMPEADSRDQSDTQSSLDPRQLLVDWANQQDSWVRRLVGHVVISRQPLGDGQVSELFDMYLAEKGIDGELNDVEPVLVYQSEAVSATDVLRLIRLHNVEGVNALATGSEIEFSPGLTILYGENGTGKTGYARVLKRLSAVRDPEEIVPNIHNSAALAPRATIEYQLGDDVKALQWQNEVGVVPFTRMSVFDSPAVNVRVDDDLSYVFTPAELSLFGYVSDGIRAVQERGNQALQSISTSSNPFVRYFQRGTKIYQQVESLGAATDLADLEDLAQLPDNATEEKARLEREIAALKSNTTDRLLASNRESLRVLRELDSLAQTVGGFDPQSYNARIGVVRDLREQYRRVRDETFAAGELAGPADDAWQRFVLAAAEYQDNLGLQSYPSEGDSCVYCRQALSADAASLIERYETFLDDALARQIQSEEQALRRMVDPVLAPRIDSVQATIGRWREASSNPELFEQARRFVEVLSSLRTNLEDREQSDEVTIGRSAADLREALLTPIAEHDRESSSLKSQLEDRDSTLAEAETQLRGIAAKIELDRRLPEMRTYVAKAKRAAKMDRLLRRISGVLRSLTEVAKTASEDLINKDFAGRFEEECESLRTPNVKLEFIGRRGEAHRRKSLTADYRLSQILSEGEQKVLAIADFLAEARMASSSAPIIFDDPVNSLDHRRLQEVSDRVAGLAESRQVIVFTHNIWLATELLSRFEKRKDECVYYMVSDDDHVGLKGLVSRASGPRWDTVKELRKRVNERLEDAGRASGASQVALVESAYGEMRSWCEVVVEEVLFGDVTRRYRANIMMGGLRNVHPDRLPAAITVIEELFDKACRYIPDHSQPLPTLSSRPSLAEAKRDWKSAQDAVKAYRSQ